jgi:hypothetical protein
MPLGAVALKGIESAGSAATTFYGAGSVWVRTATPANLPWARSSRARSAASNR